MKHLPVAGVDRHLWAAEQRGIIERADLDDHGGQSGPPREQMRSAFGAEFARDGTLEVAARELLRPAPGVSESIERHQHEHVGGAAGKILAFPAVALRLQLRLT